MIYIIQNIIENFAKKKINNAKMTSSYFEYIEK